MSEELSIVAKQQAMILDLMNEIKQLKNVVKETEKKIDETSDLLTTLTTPPPHPQPSDG